MQRSLSEILIERLTRVEKELRVLKERVALCEKEDGFKVEEKDGLYERTILEDGDKTENYFIKLSTVRA